MGDDAPWTGDGATHLSRGDGGESAKTTLRPEASGADAARRFVKDVVANRDLEALAEPAGTLAGELVRVALRSASSDLVVQVRVSSSWVRVEVCSMSRDHLLPPEGRTEATLVRSNEDMPPDGVKLLDATADDWGAPRDGDRHRLWFQLALRRDHRGLTRRRKERT